MIIKAIKVIHNMMEPLTKGTVSAQPWYDTELNPLHTVGAVVPSVHWITEGQKHSSPYIPDQPSA